MIQDIYYTGTIVACIFAIINIIINISKEEGPLDWVTELSIVIYIIIITLLSWVSILSCVYEYLKNKFIRDTVEDEEDSIY